MKIDTQDTNELICPYCGDETLYFWEGPKTDDDSWDCHSCGKRFTYKTKSWQTFSSYKIEDEEGK